MGLEIEHKYLVTDRSYRDIAASECKICQGYMSRDPERTVRIRTVDNKGYITVKGKTHAGIRHEYEYEIPFDDAKEMLAMCPPPLIEKCRYNVQYKGKTWEIDEFGGRLYPLVIAEIELACPDEVYDIPPFIGENVTGNPKYYNSNL